MVLHALSIGTCSMVTRVGSIKSISNRFSNKFPWKLHQLHKIWLWHPNGTTACPWKFHLEVVTPGDHFRLKQLAFGCSLASEIPEGYQAFLLIHGLNNMILEENPGEIWIRCQFATLQGFQPPASRQLQVRLTHDFKIRTPSRSLLDLLMCSLVHMVVRCRCNLGWGQGKGRACMM